MTYQTDSQRRAAIEARRTTEHRALRDAGHGDLVDAVEAHVANGVIFRALYVAPTLIELSAEIVRSGTVYAARRVFAADEFRHWPDAQRHHQIADYLDKLAAEVQRGRSETAARRAMRGTGGVL